MPLSYGDTMYLFFHLTISPFRYVQRSGNQRRHQSATCAPLFFGFPPAPTLWKTDIPEWAHPAFRPGFHFDPLVGTEELGHLEMVGSIVHQLTRNLKDSQILDSGFAPYFVDHTVGVYPTAASGSVFNSGMMQVKGDPMADLTEDLAAEQKARVTYDNILRLSDDPDVNDVIKFLRAREIVHFQRFGEAVQLLREKLNQKNVYSLNPARDL